MLIDLPAPEFELPASEAPTIRLSSLRGNYVILYFYPKDSTPGCTTEGLDFRQHFDDFAAHDCVILGVSRDTIRSHQNFRCKMDFPFELLSDRDEVVCQQYQVIKQKKMYGKEVRGIERSTFLIDRDGIVRAEWRGVKVPGHVEAVLERLKALYA